ncbi:MAG TPA: hypothetical protein DCW31_07985 [Lactobacillus sp.]|nr:hypothetical protein [Lactobacillus sp.]
MSKTTRKNQINLISTINRLTLPTQQLRQVLDTIESAFDEATITVTDVTDDIVLKTLQQSHVNAVSVPKIGAANGRRLAVKEYLQASSLSVSALVLHIDFDKLAIMILKAPSELDHLLAEIQTADLSDYTCINRSAVNMTTYPSTWVDTEKCTNEGAAAFFGLTVFTDFTSGAAIIRQQFLADIVRDSNAKMIDVEWPLIVTRKGGQIGSVETDGLPFTKLNREVTAKPLWQQYADRIRLVQEIIEPLH